MSDTAPPLPAIPTTNPRRAAADAIVTTGRLTYPDSLPITERRDELLAAIRDPDPVIFFEPKRIYRQYKEEVPDDGEALPLDVCFVLRDGSDVTLVSWGSQIKETLETADALAKEGISAEVIDVACLKPLDFDTILESVKKTGRCVIIHEAAKTAGFGAEIAARLAEEALYDLHAPVERVTGYDTHIPLFRLEMKYLPSVEKILAAVKRTLSV